MSSDIKGRIVRGLFANGANQLINLVILVLTQPLFFIFWSKDLYAEWIAITGLLAFLSLSDLSFGQVAASQMTVLVASGDEPQARKVYQSIAVVVTGIAITSLAIFSVIVYFTPLEKFHLRLISISDAKWILVLLAVRVCISLQQGVHYGPLRANQMYAKTVAIGATARCIEFAVTMGAIAAHIQPLHLAMLLDFNALCVTSYIIFTAQTKVPWAKGALPKLDKAAIKPVILPALSFNAFPLGNALYVNGLSTILTIVKNPTIALGFLATRTMTRFVNQATDAVGASGWTEMSAALGNGDLVLARKLHRRMCQLSFWLGLCASLSLVVLGPTAYQIYSHKELNLDYKVFYVLLLAMVVNGGYCASSVVQMSVNRHNNLARYFIVVTVLCLVFTYFSVNALGNLGAAIAVLLVESAMFVYVVPKSCAMVEDSFAGWASEVFNPPIGKLLGKLKRRSSVG